jgi:type 1 fimbriae regulatory protein FimB/type 1 fimbriae regulatory protein FimE
LAWREGETAPGFLLCLAMPFSFPSAPALIRMAFLHTLRVSELVDLRLQQIDLTTATIHIRRVKNETPSKQGDELRFLRVLRRQHPHPDYVFLSERKAPLSVDGAQKLIERLGEATDTNPLGC